MKIQKVGDLCIATLDGDGFDNHKFRGTSDEVFWQVADFLLERSSITASDEVANKTLDKIDQMRAAYDSIANLKK